MEVKEQEKNSRNWSLDILIKLALPLKAGPNTSLKMKLTCNSKYICRGSQKFTSYTQGTQISL